MINITNWPVDQAKEIDPIAIANDHRAWLAEISQMSPEQRQRLLEQRQLEAKANYEAYQARLSQEQGMVKTLKNVVRQLPPTNSRSNVIPKKEYRCKACKDLGVVRRNVPPSHPQFGRAIPCRECGLAHKRKGYERIWPVSPSFRDLYNAPIQTRIKENNQIITLKPMVRLKNMMIDFVEGWPKGVLILIEGPYGVAKTHCLAILYDRCWTKAKKTAVYVGATDLEEMYTDFSDSQNNGYDAIRNDGRFKRYSREKMLHEADFLFIDEAHRYTQRGGNGWTERQLFNLVKKRLDNHKTTVMAGNVLEPKGGEPGLHPGILDRAHAFLSLSGVSSGRPNFDRSPSAGWRKRDW